MRTSRLVQVVDSHTEGMPTRVVVGGVGVLPGKTMAERRAHFLATMNGLRTFLMREPRGHEAMSGALLQPATRPDADIGVLYMEVEGSVAACGHGAMGVATVLVETGMVDVVEPHTTIRLDTPAGLVVAEVAVNDGRAERVTIGGLPASCLGTDLRVDVPGYGAVCYDLADGGNLCAIAELAALGLPFDRAASREILSAGRALVAAIVDADPGLAALRHAQLLAPQANARHSRHAMVISPGWFDRSPCGTGTAARMAQLYARGELALHEDFVNESFLGTHFVGRLVGTTTTDGRAHVVPTISGRAWVTGTATLTLDPTDILPDGFLL